MTQDNTYRKVLKWRDRHRGQVRSSSGVNQLSNLHTSCAITIPTAQHHAHVRGGSTHGPEGVHIIPLMCTGGGRDRGPGQMALCHVFRQVCHQVTLQHLGVPTSVVLSRGQPLR